MDLSEELKLAAVKAMQVEGLGKWHIPSQERLSRLEVGVGELGEDGRESARQALAYGHVGARLEVLVFVLGLVVRRADGDRTSEAAPAHLATYLGAL